LGVGSHLPAADTRSRVVVARDPALRGSGASIDEDRLQALLDRTVASLFATSGRGAGALPANSVAVWKRIARPGQHVGIKVNTLGGPAMSTSVAVVDAICERLQQAGIKPADIVIWDRQTWEMERVGFRIAEGGNRVQCYGSDRADYQDAVYRWGSISNRLSNILLRCDMLINVPILKDHELAGVTLALKNMYGVISNPNQCHANGCDPSIADLNMLPEIRQRLRVTIGDATTAVYEGGPSRPGHSWPCNTLLASQDPVAIDFAGWQIIERKRAEKGLPTLAMVGRPTRFLKTAADDRHRLGYCDPERIVLVEA
jgi:uncharacterized protein (DUF362 family)